MIAEMSLQQEWKNLEINSFKRLWLLSHPANLARFLGYQVAPHHHAILEHILNHKKSLDLAPRGHGKSTIGTIVYSIWKILVNPDVRILIVSNTDRQAKAFLREIKSQLQSEKIISLFGELQGDKWTEEELTVGNRSKIHKEATITALGASGAVTTKHFDILICDDIVDFENARTEGQRSKLKEWYYTSLLPTLEPDGELHVYGTRYNPYDLYQTMIESEEYSVQIMRALQPDGSALWEEAFPSHILQAIKAEAGSIIFNMQYQNDVELAKEGQIFKYNWLKFYKPSELPANLKIYQGVDLAISLKETADYFSICTIGVDSDNNIFVLDIYRNRLTFKQQVEVIQAKAQQWQPVRIAVESNQYQAALSQVLKDRMLPIREVHTRKDKITRAQICSGLFEGGKVYLRENMQDFIDELLLFPDVQHDDMVDSLMLAMEVARTDQMPPSKELAGMLVMGGVRRGQDISTWKRYLKRV